MTHDARVVVLAAVSEAFALRKLTHQELAGRAGVSVKTVRRFLAGQTCSLDTAAALSRALRVDLDSGRPQVPVDAEGRGKMPKDAERLSPVVGWKEAAKVLRLHRDTVLAVRRRAGCERRPWWPSREAVLEWFAGLLAEVV